MEINHVEKTKLFDTTKCVESNLGVRSNTSSRTGIGGREQSSIAFNW